MYVYWMNPWILGLAIWASWNPSGDALMGYDWRTAIPDSAQGG